MGMPTNSRPTTRDGASQPSSQPPAVLPKDRKPSYSRRSSFSSQRRRGSSATGSSDAIVTDATAPPALPYYALAAAAKVATQQSREPDSYAAGEPLRSPSSHDDGFGPRMLHRTTTNTSANSGYGIPITPAGPVAQVGGFWQQHEDKITHQQITGLANKRINFLEYLRKA